MVATPEGGPAAMDEAKSEVVKGQVEGPYRLSQFGTPGDGSYYTIT